MDTLNERGPPRKKAEYKRRDAVPSPCAASVPLHRDGVY